MDKEGGKPTGPWIESMILRYGSLDSWPRVKARILGISKSPHLQKELVKKPGHLVFVSDDVVQIPGILTATAWERLQRMEERESLMSLSNSTVSLCQYSLMFYADPEKSKSKFFVNIDKMMTLESGSIKHHVPNCITLPAVRQKICEMWRALQDDHSTAAMDTQSGFCLTDLLAEWHQDRINSLLKEVVGCLLPLRCSLHPQPSTSHQSPPPTPVLCNSHLNTRWDADRVRYKGDENFTVPSFHLHIPEQERQRLVPQSEEESGQGTSTCVDAPLDGDGRTDDNVEPLHLSLLDEGPQAELPVNPWDVFGSAGMDMSSLLPAEGSLTLDDVSLKDTHSVAIPSAAPPLAANIWTPDRTSKELFPFSDQSRKRTVTPVSPHSVGIGPLPPSPASVPLSLSLQRLEDESLPPYQRPHFFSTESCPNKPQTSSKGYEEKEEGPVARMSCSTSRGQQTELKKQAGRQTGSAGCSGTRSPWSWLLGTSIHGRASRSGRMVQDQRPHRATSRPKPVTIHADGAPFSYTYQATAQTAEALSSFSIPDDLLQWSVHYLARHHHEEHQVTTSTRPQDGALSSARIATNTD